MSPAMLVATALGMALLQSAGEPSGCVDPPAEALGTDEEGVELLRHQVDQHPGLSPVDAWTGLITRHNRPPPWRAPLVGGLWLAGGASIMALSAVAGGLGMIMTTAALPGTQLHRLATEAGGASRLAPAFPWLAAFLWDLSFLPPLFAGLAAATSVAAIRPSSRPLHVSSTGGCRDERRLARAFSPTGWERVAPYLAALGGLAGILGTVGYLAAAVATWPLISIVTLAAGRTLAGPSVDLGTTPNLGAVVLASAIFMTGFWLATVPFGGAALVASVVMMYRRQPSPFSGGD